MKPAAVQSVLVKTAELSAAVCEEMFALHAEHFAGVTMRQFCQDLEEKSHVLHLRKGSRLVGFTTLLAYESQFERTPVSVVYSGDTIVSPEAWGSTALARGWISAVNSLRSTVPRGRFYWLLLTSGFRTYRFLPVFWRNFHPRFDAPMPPEMAKLRDHLASERFGRMYDAARGIVRFKHPQQLRGALTGIPDGRQLDPDVAFFLSKNPGHAAGDELVCLTELCAANLTPAGRRMASTDPACS